MKEIHYLCIQLEKIMKDDVLEEKIREINFKQIFAEDQFN